MTELSEAHMRMIQRIKRSTAFAFLRHFVTIMSIDDATRLAEIAAYAIRHSGDLTKEMDEWLDEMMTKFSERKTAHETRS